jgi:phytoene synthase
MRSCDTRAMKPARLMGATYAAILSRLERRGWSSPHERLSLPVWQKLWLALRYGLA